MAGEREPEPEPEHDASDARKGGENFRDFLNLFPSIPSSLKGGLSSFFSPFGTFFSTREHRRQTFDFFSVVLDVFDGSTKSKCVVFYFPK